MNTHRIALAVVADMTTNGVTAEQAVERAAQMLGISKAAVAHCLKESKLP